jgi:hypothetical protein
MPQEAEVSLEINLGWRGPPRRRPGSSRRVTSEGPLSDIKESCVSTMVYLDLSTTLSSQWLQCASERDRSGASRKFGRDTNQPIAKVISVEESGNERL